LPNERLTFFSSFSRNRRPISIDGLEQSVDPSRGVRWNLYLTDVRGGSGKVTVRLYEAGNRSQPIAEKDFDVAALGRVRMETLFAAMGLDSNERRKDRANVLCVVTPKSGTSLISALAVSIDNRTGDSQTWLLTPTGGVPATTTLAGQVALDAQRRRPVRR